jgi:hypothetical protein
MARRSRLDALHDRNELSCAKHCTETILENIEEHGAFANQWRCFNRLKHALLEQPAIDFGYVTTRTRVPSRQQKEHSEN